MTNHLEPALPLSVRLNRLFAVFHRRGAPEQATTHVARLVEQILDQPVQEHDIDAIRAGARDRGGADDALLAALAQHFQIPPVYLTDKDGDGALAIDRELRLLLAARDAGVRHIALRGDDVDVEALTTTLSELTDNESGFS